jgi:hypothetical protein
VAEAPAASARRSDRLDRAAVGASQCAGHSNVRSERTIEQRSFAAGQRPFGDDRSGGWARPPRAAPVRSRATAAAAAARDLPAAGICGDSHNPMTDDGDEIAEPVLRWIADRRRAGAIS